jgi:hypothetical protein
MAKRPFWMHQAVEYLLGGVLLALGLQSPTPAVPAVLAMLILLNAAITRGPLSAFRWVSPALHQRLDGVLLVVLVIGGVQPFVSIDSGTRLMILGIAFVFGVVWRQSSFTERRRGARPAPADVPEGDRATALGKKAGRMVGSAIDSAKKLGGDRQ